MIWYYILLFITTLLAAAFSWLPQVSTLPSIGGVDIDAQLVSGFGYFYAFITAIWPLQDVWFGFLVLLSYYSIKMVLRFLLGHRAP